MTKTRVVQLLTVSSLIFWGLAWWTGALGFLLAGLAAVSAAFLLQIRGSAAVVTAPGVAAGGPGPAAPARRCDTCQAFDLKVGQAVLEHSANFPSFFLSPDQMGASQAKMLAEVTPGADGTPDVLASDLVQKKLGGRLHSWDQYGACGRDNVLTNRYDVCDAWVARED